MLRGKIATQLFCTPFISFRTKLSGKMLQKIWARKWLNLVNKESALPVVRSPAVTNSGAKIDRHFCILRVHPSSQPKATLLHFFPEENELLRLEAASLQWRACAYIVKIFIFSKLPRKRYFTAKKKKKSFAMVAITISPRTTLALFSTWYSPDQIS